MAIWLHTKTKAQCRAAKQEHKGKLPYFTKACRICGKDISKGTYCESCQQFITDKRNKERTGRQ